MMFNLQPTLESNLVLLRPLNTEDYQDLFSAASDPLIWQQHPESTRHQPETFEKYFSKIKGTQGCLVIIDKLTKKIIGSSTFYDVSKDNPSLVIGYTFLKRSYWGGKYNSEIKHLMLTHAFKFVDLVYFHVGKSNIRSKKAIEKIGAVSDAQSFSDNEAPLKCIYRIDREIFFSQKPQIELANLSDLNELCSLVNQTFGQHPKLEELFGKWIKEPQYHVTVAKINRQIVGVAASYINFSPDLTKYELFGTKALNFLKDQKLGWFLTLAVPPEHRRKDIGWSLARGHASWLRGQGCTSLVGTSWVSGAADNSVHMFIKSGFQHLGESNEFLRNQLQGTDSICSACHKNDCECKSVLFGLSLLEIDEKIS